MAEHLILRRTDMQCSVNLYTGFPVVRRKLNCLDADERRKMKTYEHWIRRWFPMAASPLLLLWVREVY